MTSADERSILCSPDTNLMQTPETMTTPADILLVQTTCPDAQSARDLADNLLKQGLAGCINLINDIESHYCWKGERKQGTETLLLIKSPAAKYPALEAAIRSGHPYELPEIIAVSLSAGLPAYLNWVAASAPTHPAPKPQ